MSNNIKEPLVSVIIPAYNCAGTISEAIDSALKQRISKEILVINDCSVEDLNIVLKQYEHETEIRYIQNEKNIGAAATRNRGVQLARGKYIAFLDADDIWQPDKLEKQMKLLEETKHVMCVTARELIRPDGTHTGHVIPVQNIITYKDLLKHNSINCSSVVILREVALEFPMHHEDSHEDYIMWLEILGKYEAVSGINEPLLKYRVSNTGKSGSKWKSAKMTFMVYRYMGFGWMKAVFCFCSYAWHGILKYYGWKN